LFAIFFFVCFFTPFKLLAKDTSVDISPTPTLSVIEMAEEPPAGINLTISPNFLNLTAEPGETINAQLKIKNNNNFREFLFFNIYRLESRGGEETALAKVSEDDEFVQWLAFSEKEFILEPNETKAIKITITTPETAALGYYYTLAATRIKERAASGNLSLVTGAPAVTLLLEVKSPYAKRELQLIGFATDKQIYEYLPVKFSINLKNNGNIHSVPFGDIFIDQGQKKNLGILAVNEGRGNVLPKGEREFTSSVWEDGFPVFHEKNSKKNLFWDWGKVNKFRLGKYTAHLLLVYDDGKRDIPLESAVSFWVIPWKILLAGLIIIVLVLLGVRGLIIMMMKKIRQIVKRLKGLKVVCKNF